MNNAQPLRIQVVGTSCVGKSTFAKELASILEIPYVELDALHWGPNWTEASAEEFQSRVTAATNFGSWVVDGSYGRKAGTTLADRNFIIWLDLPLTKILARFTKRSLTRWLTGEILWGGCKETLRNSVYGKDSLLFWILRYHHAGRRTYSTLLNDPPSDTEIIRLGSPLQVREFLAKARLQKTVPEVP